MTDCASGRRIRCALQYHDGENDWNIPRFRAETCCQLLHKDKLVWRQDLVVFQAEKGCWPMIYHPGGKHVCTNNLLSWTKYQTWKHTSFHHENRILYYRYGKDVVFFKNISWFREIYFLSLFFGNNIIIVTIKKIIREYYFQHNIFFVKVITQTYFCKDRSNKFVRISILHRRQRVDIWMPEFLLVVRFQFWRW